MVWKFLIIVLLEVLVALFFTVISIKYKTENHSDWKKIFAALKWNKIDKMSVFKGGCERIFISFSLLYGFPHVLTLFGALKLGTRLKRADDEKTAEGRKRESAYNDYFLLGNFLSVGLSIVYYVLLKQYVIN
ncbi:hypothetical protein SAMN04488018_12719 [Myroides marinus]|uniref:Uncharacterized protein n=1 Tax=Myroides marinus TaxID=703342 RepID=A0A1H6Y264_9FLAO|nr:hypothetical protein [Myroides marinus]SEJ35351.1 hypothetical protein SAMN04488018_12719 [Myroides marinus]